MIDAAARLLDLGCRKLQVSAGRRLRALRHHWEAKLKVRLCSNHKMDRRAKF